MLKKGDPCYVRHNGKIKDATYIEPAHVNKFHYVKIKGINNGYILAVDCKPSIRSVCRFVCMTGIKGKYNEKQS